MTELPASRKLLNITKAALDHCEAECERLRAELEALSDPFMRARIVERDAAIEECARVVNAWSGFVKDRNGLIAAIRALKGKP